MMFSRTDYGFDFETFFFGPRRRRRGRRRKWKIFERGDLKFVILRLVSERPMHGYEVMKALERESAGCYRPSPGSVYPTLQMLEDEGYVSSEEQHGKRVYSVTEEGRTYLEENQDVIDDVFERVERFTDRFFGRDMKKLSKSFSRLAQLTIDQALSWGAAPEDLERMNEILERAMREMDEVRRDARDRRRSGDPREAGHRPSRDPEGAPRADRVEAEADEGA